jgi:O-antigen/teichoic acid export membrane protein
MRPLLRQSSRYLAQVVLGFFYSQYQVPLNARRLGTHDAGIFRSAFMMAAGLELAFNSATCLVLPRLVRWHAEGVDVFRRRQRAMAQRFALIGFAAWIAASLVAPLLFERVLGGDFAAATPVFRILVLGRAIVFVGQVFMFGLTALHRDDAFLGVTLAGCAVSLATNALVIDSIGLVGVAWASVLAETVILVVGWRLCARALDHSTAIATAAATAAGPESGRGPGAGPWT